MRTRLNPRGRGFMNPPGNKPINANVPRQGGQKQRRQKEPRPTPGKPDGGHSKPRGATGRGSGERDYLKPPTQKSINQQVRGETQTKFRPLEREIGSEIRASNRRVSEEGDWWQNYLDTVNAGQADTSAAYAGAAATQQAQLAQASQTDSAATAKLQEEAAKSAELRGAPTDLSGAQREVAAQGMRNYLGAAQGGALASQGAAQRGYLNEAKRIGVGQSIASRKEQQRITRSKERDRRDVRGERGAYANAKRGEKEAEGRSYLIQRKAFGLQKKEAGQKAKESAVERGESRRKERYERKQDQIGNRQAQERIGVSRNNSTDGKTGRTPAEKRDAEEGARNAKATAERLVKGHGVPRTAKEWSDLEEAVAKESEVSAAEARKAIAGLKARARKQAPTQGNRGAPNATEVPYAP